MKLNAIIKTINNYADEKAACEWDNSGLQIGSPDSDIYKVLICLDVTEYVVHEAITCGAQLIVSHHPFFFFPIKSVTDDEKSRMLKKLLANNISVYSSHTCFDASKYGINAYCAFRMGVITDSFLEDSEIEGMGVGICGELKNAKTFVGLCSEVKKIFGAPLLKISAFCPAERVIKRVAFCGGSGASYIKKAKELGADALITADVSNGKFLDAQMNDLPIISMTHFESEKCFVKIMKDILLKEARELTVVESNAQDIEKYV